MRITETRLSWRWHYRFVLWNSPEFCHTAASLFNSCFFSVVFLFVCFFSRHILRPLCLFRVLSQHHHHHCSDGHQSDSAVALCSHALTLSSAIHTSRSGPDQQQQQQERHIYWRSSQTGGWLDKGNCSGGQSAATLPEPDETAEASAGPGRQSNTSGSSYAWGIWNRDEQSVTEGISNHFRSCTRVSLSHWGTYFVPSVPDEML